MVRVDPVADRASSPCALGQGREIVAVSPLLRDGASLELPSCPLSPGIPEHLVRGPAGQPGLARAAWEQTLCFYYFPVCDLVRTEQQMSIKQRFLRANASTSKSIALTIYSGQPDASSSCPLSAGDPSHGAASSSLQTCQKKGSKQHGWEKLPTG